ncbi:MAG: hypothetical protein ABI333_06645 [bacterium]
MNVRMVRVAVAACWLAALAVTVSCETPGFPMPPPCGAQHEVQWISTDEVVLRLSSCHLTVGAEVMVKNLRLQLFVSGPAGSDGSFASSPFLAAEGDVLEVLAFAPEGRIGRFCLLLSAASAASAQLTECPDS